MNDELSNDNWLDAKIINCPKCAQELYRVNHSPMLDSHTLYCDHCANSVEVDFNDPIYSSIYKRLIVQETIQYQNLMRIVEKRLKPCNCGGHFKHDASRRCHNCLSEVITSELGVDLYPSIFAINLDELNPEPVELKEVYAYEASHIRRNDIWIK